MSMLGTDVISDPGEVSPAWLSDVLRGARVLPSGNVASLSHELILEYNSMIYRLHVRYDDAPPEAPATLILKLKEGNGARDELALGRRFDPHRAHLPMLLAWYHAAYSARDDRGHFLMRDLSETHVQTVSVVDATGGRAVPPQAQLERIIDTIAHFHAYLWQHAQLREMGDIPAAYSSAQNFREQIIAPRQDQLANFIRTEGASVPPEMLQLFEREIAGLPQLYGRWIEPRLNERKGVTLVHGDCYFGQFQCPKAPARDCVYMLDLESAHTFIPGLDLYNLFASFWSRANRHDEDRELRCLTRYHDQLTMRGVRDFDLQLVIKDYRVAIALMVFHPVWDKVVGGSRRAYWWPKMQCLCDAYVDWKCDELMT
jgi:hypothetical protein